MIVLLIFLTRISKLFFKLATIPSTNMIDETYMPFDPFKDDSPNEPIYVSKTLDPDQPFDPFKDVFQCDSTFVNPLQTFNLNEPFDPFKDDSPLLKVGRKYYNDQDSILLCRDVDDFEFHDDKFDDKHIFSAEFSSISLGGLEKNLYSPTSVFQTYGLKDIKPKQIIFDNEWSKESLSTQVAEHREPEIPPPPSSDLTWTTSGTIIYSSPSMQDKCSPFDETPVRSNSNKNKSHKIYRMEQEFVQEVSSSQNVNTMHEEVYCEALAFGRLQNIMINVTVKGRVNERCKDGASDMAKRKFQINISKHIGHEKRKMLRCGINDLPESNSPFEVKTVLRVASTETRTGIPPRSYCRVVLSVFAKEWHGTQIHLTNVAAWITVPPELDGKDVKLSRKGARWDIKKRLIMWEIGDMISGKEKVLQAQFRFIDN